LALAPIIPGILGLLGIPGVLACSRVERAGEGGGAALMRNLLRTQAVEIVADPGPIQDACLKAAERISRALGVACRVLSPGERGDARAPRIVVGGPLNPSTVSVLGRLGVQVGVHADRPYFAFHRAFFGGWSDALVAVLEDPDRPGLPLTVLYGNDLRWLERCAREIEPGWKPWFRIYRAAALSCEGPLDGNGSILESFLVDAEHVRLRELGGYAGWPAREEGLRGSASREVDPARRDAYLEAVGRARKETARWAGSSEEPSSGDDPRPLQLILHARPESLAACASGAGLSTWNLAKNEVHALVAEGIPHDSGLAAARARAEELLGPPAAPWLADGAAAHGAGRWWGRDLEEWVAWLRLGGLGSSVAALVDPQAAETNSPHAILPLRAALFRFLLQSRGEACVRDLWTGKTALFVDAEIEKAFVTWLDDLAARHRGEIVARRAERRSSLLSESFLPAVGIEEPGRSPARGFGSAAYLESLEEARSIGARGAALTCFVADDRIPTAVPALLYGERLLEPFESDLRVFSGLCQARASGMRTVLQPHLLTAPAGTLSGTGPLGDENGWRKFFDDYTRFAVHVGLLCELADADGIVLGGGMSASTSAELEGQGANLAVTEWKRQGWSRVIRAARGAFSGTMTWAAASGLEANQLLFWDDLDAVGCDLDLELDERDFDFEKKPGPEIGGKIGGQLHGLEMLASRLGKPLVLTQAGSRSGVSRPGERRDGGFTDDPGLQCMQIDVLGDQLRAARERGSLRGVILWRWSSDPTDKGVNGRDGLLRKGPVREAAARALAGL
jgi:hypothetical protein